MDTADAAVSARTALELLATLMEAGFKELGEGVVLGTMPTYMERFGLAQARELRERFNLEAPTGAASALSTSNFLSDITDTDYSMVDATHGHATKRLHACEFMDAFDGRGAFPRAMICRLHQAAYQGMVNGNVPHADGFDVQVRSRILFGDPHCDFEVLARSPQDAVKDTASSPSEGQLEPGEREVMAYRFYTYMLASFVDYLSQQLSAKRMATILAQSAEKVGGKVFSLMELAGILPTDGEGAARDILTRGGRTLGDDLCVTACPQAQPIQAATGESPDPLQSRKNACQLCTHLVAGAVKKAEPGANISRSTSIAAGDSHCNFDMDSR